MENNDTQVIELRHNGSEIHILVVEDSPTQAAQLQRTLAEHGYQASSVSSGQEALSHIREHRVDIVVSDIVMPEMDGYELCTQIKSDEKTKGIPVVLLTQLSDPEDIVKGLACGADNFITKPYDEGFLLTRIEYILINQKLRAQAMAEMGIEIFFAGQKHFVTSDRMQIVDLLLSTYEAAVRKNRELERANRELREAMGTIKALRGLIPICANCKKVRDDQGYWRQVEEYIREHTEAEFSHGLCPECVKTLYPDFCGKKSGP